MTLARVAELVDAHDSKSCFERGVGSIPTSGTNLKNTHYCVFFKFVPERNILEYISCGNRKTQVYFVHQNKIPSRGRRKL
jgi:hypothetical protein